MDIYRTVSAVVVLSLAISTHFALADLGASCPALDSSVNSTRPLFHSSKTSTPQGITAFESYAVKLFTRLTGSSLSLRHPRFRRVVSLVQAGKFTEAARFVTEEQNFLQVRVRNFAAPFSSKDFALDEPFNDLQALIIGLTRDEKDARLLLTGDLRYSAGPSAGLPAVSRKDNDHYLAFDQRGLSYRDDLELSLRQWDDQSYAVGALTTRAWAKVHYDAGTNRRSLKNALDVFLCVPIENWKVRGVPDFFVRRDVDRTPGGNPATYQNTCRSCHAILDGMGGAISRVDFKDATFSYLADSIAPKMNQNGNVYPAGYVTADDGWTNLLSYSASIDFGWRTSLEGQGLKDFGKMLSESTAFSRCLVKRAYTEVCGGSAPQSGANSLPNLTQDFEADGYNLKHLFAKVATLPECLAHPGGKL